MPCHDELICPCLGLKKHHLYHQSLNGPPASVPRVLSKQPCDISTPDLPSLAEGRGVIRTKKLGLNPHKRGDHNRLFFCCPVLAPALPIVQSIDIMISLPRADKWQTKSGLLWPVWWWWGGHWSRSPDVETPPRLGCYNWNISVFGTLAT